MMTLAQLPERQQPLAALLGGFADAPTVAVSGLSMDSRSVPVGGLFLACNGGHSHGLQFVESAMQHGAAAIAWEPAPGVAPPQLPVPAVAVPELARRAGEVAARFYGHPSTGLFMVGVTGTDGKTSTAWLISQALAQLGQSCGYMGTLGYGFPQALATASHTTPDAVAVQAWLARLQHAGAQAVAMEVSSHALDQGRVNGTGFDVAVLTNLTRDHLDYHGDVAHYAAAKRRLFDMPGLRAAVLNVDDAYGQQWLQALPQGCAGIAYGVGSQVPAAATRHVLADEPQLHAGGLRLELSTSAGQALLESPLLGRFNAYNLLAALAVLLEHEVPLTTAVQVLGAVQPVPGRMQALHAGGQPLVVVDYAHTPQALVQALAAMRAHTPGKLICVFGCGGDRDRGKRAPMAAAVAAAADYAVVTDDNPRHEAPEAIVAELLKGMPAGFAYCVEHDRARAIHHAIAMAGAQDAVLIAGKGHEDYQLYADERRHFSDVAQVRELLQLPQEASHAPE